MAEWITFVGPRRLETGEWTDKQDFREPIVRFRDCVWYEAKEYRRYFDRTGSFQIEPDGFCAWGERSEKVDNTEQPFAE